MWINRDIYNFVETSKGVVQIFRGPRQVGKSSLVLKLSPDFRELSLDELNLRDFARRDPELFLDQFKGQKLFIDEVQYAPELFSAIKRRVDLLKRDPQFKRETRFRLTGSNQILMDRQVKESLAGRAEFFDLGTLSVREVRNSLGQDFKIQQILFQGGWPELYRDAELSVRDYLDAYISSYIEKDVVLAAGIQKQREFLVFLKMLAGRVGQVINWSQLGNEVGLDAKTVKDWISVLSRMGIVTVVSPFMTNRSSRLTKAPKLYFNDTGLAVRLQGWTSPEAVLFSPLQGLLFENLVFTELNKLNQNFSLGWSIYFWRTKDQDEVDFVIEMPDQQFLFLEVKLSRVRLKPLSERLEVRKVFGPQLPLLIQVVFSGEEVLGDLVPISKLGDWLLKNFKSNRNFEF